MPSLITAKELADAQHYDESEHETIQMFIDGAEAFLQGAGAYHIDNPLTRTAVILIVGNWLQNREQDYTDYRSVKDFPIAIRGIITQLQYHSSVTEV